MKTFGHKRPRRDESGAIIEHKESPAAAVTVGALDGTFGADRGKRLVVSLESQDLIVVRIARTSRRLSIKASDLWFYLLRCKANLESLQSDGCKTLRKK